MSLDVRFGESIEQNLARLSVKRPFTCDKCGGYVVGGGCTCTPQATEKWRTKQAVDAERERCAKTVENFRNIMAPGCKIMYADEIAAKIRSSE